MKWFVSTDKFECWGLPLPEIFLCDKLRVASFQLREVVSLRFQVADEMFEGLLWVNGVTTSEEVRCGVVVLRPSVYAEV